MHLVSLYISYSFICSIQLQMDVPRDVAVMEIPVTFMVPITHVAVIVDTGDHVVGLVRILYLYTRKYVVLKF